MYPAERYGDLKLIARLLKLVAWLALIGGIVAAVMAMTNLSSIVVDSGARLGIALAILLFVGVANFVQFYIIGGLLTVLVDMEYNTRANTALIERLLKASADQAS